MTIPDYNFYFSTIWELFFVGGRIKCKGNGDLAVSNQELISYLCDRQPQCSPTNPLFCDFSLE